MSDVEGKLSAKQETAILALLSYRTVREAAKSAKVGESTLLRWLTAPAFRDRHEAERRQLFDGAKNALRSAAHGAVETLVEVQSDGEAPAGAKVTAAKAVLDLCMRIQENDDILLRLERLEKAAGGSDGRQQAAGKGGAQSVGRPDYGDSEKRAHGYPAIQAHRGNLL